MNDFFITVYVGEIFMQKEFALASYENFLNALNTQKSPKDCFYQIHHFLVHTSNIVKILFPKNNLKDSNNTFVQARAKAVRKKLNISEDDFNISEIGIRNDFEHFDTRIDFWIQNSKQHNYCDMNIFTPEAIQGIDVKDMFRNLDPQNKILTFCKKQYNLKYLKDFLTQKILRE